MVSTSNVKEIEKSLENARAVRRKRIKIQKRSHPEDMLDKHTSTIQELQAEVKKIRVDNDQLLPSLKETQEKLSL